MTFNQYVPNHKQWDHVGNITPNVEYSEPHRPHGEYMVADWLPVGRWEKYYEEYFTVSVGKILAFDREGNVVPAGLKVAFAVTTGNVLTYTATDSTEGVVDITTGATVASVGAAYTRTQLTTALRSRGLINTAENAEDFISHAVGVAPYNFYKWAGGDGFNPAQYHHHNKNMQHRVSILCKYVIEVPHVPAAHAGVTMDATASIGAFASWTTDEWLTNAALQALVRYAVVAAADTDIIALNLPVLNLAKSTTITPITFGGACATFFIRERTDATLITTDGDYFIDYDVGVILVRDSAATPPSLIADSVDFYHYDAVPGTVSTYACVLGDVVEGDFLMADANSNFVKADPVALAAGDIAVTTTGDPTDAELAVIANQAVTQTLARQNAVIGQVLDQEAHPRDYLDRVRTAYTNLPLTGVLDQMPGTASAGLPTQITYASASDRMVRILLLK